MKRELCGGCGSAELETFLDLGSTPLADAFPKEAQPQRRYLLQVAVCRSCWLAQLLEVVDDRELYGGDYGFFSSTSPSVVAYHRDYADWALSLFGQRADRLTVEIACNDGSLLQHFRDAGCRTLGVEPAKNTAAVAFERGLDVIAEPFGRRVAEAIRAEYGSAGLVIANNVVAHVADLDDFIGGVADLLGPDGVFVAEVQYLADLLAGNQFDHVYHEHRYYFSLSALEPVLARHGLHIGTVLRTQAQGGSLRIVATRAATPDTAVQRTRRCELWLRGRSVYAGMQGRVDHVRSRLLDLLADEKGAGRTIAGYAASAKSTTLLNYCGVGTDALDHVVDTTPYKIGRVTPGTHIPIVAPGERPEPDTYLLLAWNYLPGVLQRERAFIDNGGRFIVPIPVPVIL